MNSSSSLRPSSTTNPNKRSAGQGLSSTGQAVKKLVIKPFKSQPKLPQNYEQDTWAKLALALHAVNAKVATDISKEELYRAVEDLCLHKFGGMVYDNLMRECEGHIFQQVDGLCDHLQPPGDHGGGGGSYHDGTFLTHVDRIWQEHCEQMNTVRNIFLYLDRSYALQTPGIRSLWDLGLDLFRKRLEYRHEVQSKIVVGLLAAVEAERQGLGVDREVVRRLLRMLVALGLYHDRFEVPFLADSRRFFLHEGQALATQSIPISNIHPHSHSHSLGDMVKSEHTNSSSSLNYSTDSGGSSSSSDQAFAAGYLMHVERRLLEAHDMVTRYLDPSSKVLLLQAVEAGLLSPHAPTLVERGLGPLLDATAATTSSSSASSSTSFGAIIGMPSSSSSSSSSSSMFSLSPPVQNLRRMFSLLDRVGVSDLLKAGWSHYLRRAGEVIVLVDNNNTASTGGGSGIGVVKMEGGSSGVSSSSSSSTSRDKSLVDDLLAFQERMECVLRFAFGNHEGFRYALKSAFEHFLNLQPSRPAKLLADFVDRKMRGEKGLGDAEVDAVLDKVMSLFRFLQSKDTFERFYKNKLAKRLLLGKSASYDLERAMLTKLKTECGANFTAKLEGMFQDVELSRDAMMAFSLHCNNNNNNNNNHTASSSSSSSSSSGGGFGRTSKGEPEADFQVLTTGYWPTSPPMEGLILPSELLVLQERFTSFYCQKYQGRRLQWAHSHQRCVLTARFPKGKKELEVSLYQALVLLCFNNNRSNATNTTNSSSSGVGSGSGGSELTSDRWSLSDLRAATGMEDGELRRTLQSLASGMIGTRVLTKDPKGKDVGDHDCFVYNSDFQNKLFHIKFNQIQLRDTDEEVERTHEEVFRDRQYQVDATIVRVMKARKRLQHTLLMAELMSQLRFPATASDLKKRIASLIEREYLERDADDPSCYKYLA